MRKTQNRKRKRRTSVYRHSPISVEAKKKFQFVFNTKFSRIKLETDKQKRMTTYCSNFNDHWKKIEKPTKKSINISYSTFSISFDENFQKTFAKKLFYFSTKKNFFAFLLRLEFFSACSFLSFIRQPLSSVI